MKIDVITGFLGAGKTTFISKYAKYLKEKGENFIIIENEFGLAGIDGSILKKEELEVVEIAGGCVCCTQRAKLIYTITKAHNDGYDKVVLEPSGIYNLDTLFSVIDEVNETCDCEINSIITIVKPDFMKDSQGEYKNIFMSQFLSTGAIVFSNTQSCTSEKIDQSLIELDDFAKNSNSNFNLGDVEVYTQDWKDFTEEDFEKLSKVGRTFCEHRAVFENHATFIENIMLLTKLKKREDIDELVGYIFNFDKADILRVKGYATANGEIYSVNCTPECKEIKLSKYKHSLLNVIGINIDRESLENKVKILSL